MFTSSCILLLSQPISGYDTCLQLIVGVILLPSTSAVKLAGDWVGHVRELLLLLLEVLLGGGCGILLEPLLSLLDGLDEGLLVILVDLLQRG